jgi:hypothetical protein
MGKRTEGEPTKHTGFRLRVSTVQRLVAYAAAHPLQPSLAQIVDAAVREWLDHNEPLLPGAKPPAKPPRGKA